MSLSERISELDGFNMFDIIKSFPKQIITALNIIENNYALKSYSGINKVLILGMGGSAIGGDLLRSYLNVVPGANHLNIQINRNYDIPNHIDNHTLVIASSYSGDTEETLSGVSQASEKTKNIICVTTGGALSKYAVKHQFPIVKLPSGLQPRAALGYSFFALLGIFMKAGIINVDVKSEISETYTLLDKKSAIYSVIDDTNPAIILAKSLHNKAIVLYSASDRTDIVNLRWRGQIHENAKNLAFGSLMPEMNHNEINSFSFPEHVLNEIQILLMRDNDDHPRVKVRFEAVEQLLKSKNINTLTVSGEGNSVLARIFDLIYLGDWVSYYLAMLNNVDPTPIPLILELKKILSEK